MELGEAGHREEEWRKEQFILHIRLPSVTAASPYSVHLLRKLI